MASPYYVSPEQVVQDRSEFVQKGIEKAKEVTGMEIPYKMVCPREGDPGTLVASQNLLKRHLIGFQKIQI